MHLTAYALGYARARKLTAPPVIIGGCERSGTTLLTAMLSAHPRIHAIGRESWAFCYGRAAGFRSTRIIRPLRLYRHLGSEPVKPGARRWCEKSPANVHYFDRIRDHFRGHVRLIQIVRDGRDVVVSEHPGKPGEPWVSVRRWKQAAAAGLRHLHDPDVLTVRYRDLVLDFREQAARICTFLDEPLAPEFLDWHRHATLRASENLIGSTVPPLHSASLRKFERPGCRHIERVEELEADPLASVLLSAYGFDLQAVV